MTARRLASLVLAASLGGLAATADAGEAPRFPLRQVFPVGPAQAAGPEMRRSPLLPPGAGRRAADAVDGRWEREDIREDIEAGIISEALEGMTFGGPAQPVEEPPQRPLAVPGVDEIMPRQPAPIVPADVAPPLFETPMMDGAATDGPPTADGSPPAAGETADGAPDEAVGEPALAGPAARPLAVPGVPEIMPRQPAPIVPADVEPPMLVPDLGAAGQELDDAPAAALAPTAAIESARAPVPTAKPALPAALSPPLPPPTPVAATPAGVALPTPPVATTPAATSADATAVPPVAATPTEPSAAPVVNAVEPAALPATAAQPKSAEGTTHATAPAAELPLEQAGATPAAPAAGSATADAPADTAGTPATSAEATPHAEPAPPAELASPAEPETAPTSDAEQVPSTEEASDAEPTPSAEQASHAAPDAHAEPATAEGHDDGAHGEAAADRPNALAPPITRPAGTDGAPTPAAAPLPPGDDPDATPVRLVRTLQLLQDRMASGSATALKAQRVLLTRIEGRFAKASPETWQDKANAYALVTFVLSGGNPATLRDVLGRTPPPPIDDQLMRGVLAYADGREDEAAQFLSKIDPYTVPASMGAQVALAKAALAVRDDTKHAIGLLDTARLLAPGTLAEEAALRREIFVVSQLNDVDKFEILSTQYLMRFRHSVYAGNFRQRFAAALTRMDFVNDPKEFGRLDAMISDLDDESRREIYLLVARAAVNRGLTNACMLASERVLAIAEPDSVDAARARLYRAAAVVVTPQGLATGMADLASIDPTRLPPDDAALHQAATSTGKLILTAPDLPDTSAQETATPQSVAASASGDETPMPDVATRAQDALAAVDELLKRSDR